MFIFLTCFIAVYLILGVGLYFHDLFKGTSKNASLRNVVRKIGLNGLCQMLWLTMPGFILFWGLGADLREKAAEWLYAKIL